MWERNKIRILSWLAVIFFATTISMGISFLYYRHQEIPVEEAVEEAIEVPAQRRTRFFREELNLQPEQVEIFRQLNRNFNRTAWQLTHRLEQLRVEMVKEMGAQNPDKMKLEAVTQEIGELHTGLKNLTVEYYLGMKEVCTPEQQKRLNEIFISVLQKDEEVKLPGKGRGRNNRRFN